MNFKYKIFMYRIRKMFIKTTHSKFENNNLFLLIFNYYFRLEQERSLLSKQMESLNDDLHQKTEELLNLRRDNTLRCIQLETKLTEKIQELSIATDQIKALTDMNTRLEQNNDEISAKLIQQKELYAKTTESFNNELQAQTKLAELHKKSCEEHAEHIKKLTAAIEEVS